MQGQHSYQPELISQIDYDQLIPTNHLLRKIDNVLDLNFLSELTKPLYSEEVGYNLAYRWFCKLSLQNRVPNHSSMTRIRDRMGEDTFKKIFLTVIEQCRSAGL